MSEDEITVSRDASFNAAWGASQSATRTPAEELAWNAGKYDPHRQAWKAICKEQWDAAWNQGWKARGELDLKNFEAK